MSEHFINDDVELRHNIRKAAKISIDEFRDIIKNKLSCTSSYFDFETRIAGFCIYDDIICRDNEYNVAFDTILMDNDENDPYGYQTYENGLTFYGFKACGDWEFPVFMIIYYDGENLRLYTPIYGNAVNLDSYTAIGSESGYDSRLTQEKIEEYKKLGFYKNNDLYCSPYLRKYKMKHLNEVPTNYDAIKKDILAAIEVI